VKIYAKGGGHREKTTLGIKSVPKETIGRAPARHAKIIVTLQQRISVDKNEKEEKEGTGERRIVEKREIVRGVTSFSRAEETMKGILEQKQPQKPPMSCLVPATGAKDGGDIFDEGHC